MTFDEWYEANADYMHPVDLKAWMSEAWDAAATAEREACENAAYVWSAAAAKAIGARSQHE